MYKTAARRQKKKSLRTSRSIVTPEAAALRKSEPPLFCFFGGLSNLAPVPQARLSCSDFAYPKSEQEENVSPLLFLAAITASNYFPCLQSVNRLLSLLINDFIICSSLNKLIIIVTTFFSLCAKYSLKTFLSLHMRIVSVTAFCVIPCSFVCSLKTLQKIMY